jgi:hypothetical protein
MHRSDRGSSLVYTNGHGLYGAHLDQATSMSAQPGYHAKGLPTARCSFCGKTSDKVAKVVAGPNGIYICNECIDLSYEIVHEPAAFRPT